MKPLTPLALVCLAGLATCLAGCGTGQHSGPTPAGATSALPPVETKTAKPAVMTREDFKAAVMDKTPDEVIKAVGKPDTTSEDASGQAWYYEHRTKDTVTGKVDFRARIRIEDGTVKGVSY